jgi:hypothetical protein
LKEKNDARCSILNAGFYPTSIPAPQLSNLNLYSLCPLRLCGEFQYIDDNTMSDINQSPKIYLNIFGGRVKIIMVEEV